MIITKTKSIIDPNLISDADYEIGCRILDKAVRAYFAKPGVREEYEEWLKTEEGRAAASPPTE